MSNKKIKSVTSELLEQYRKSKNPDLPFFKITSDTGFKQVFGDKEMLIGLLNELLPELKISQINDIRMLKNSRADFEQSPSQDDSATQLTYSPQEAINPLTNRRSVMDITCTTERGEHITIEMQSDDSLRHFPDRALYYAALEIALQIKQGQLVYKLAPLYTICFLNYKMLDRENYLHYVSYHYDDEPYEVYQFNKQHFVFVELPKFDKTESECTSLLDKILYLMIHLHEMKNAPESFKNDEYIEKMIKFAQIANMEDETLLEYYKSMITAEEYKASFEIEKQLIREAAQAEGLAEGLAEGEAKGLAEGRAEGLAEGALKKALETAKNLLVAGVSLEIITSSTGLTEAEVTALQQS